MCQIDINFHNFRESSRYYRNQLPDLMVEIHIYRKYRGLLTKRQQLIDKARPSFDCFDYSLNVFATRITLFLVL